MEIGTKNLPIQVREIGKKSVAAHALGLILDISNHDEIYEIVLNPVDFQRLGSLVLDHHGKTVTSSEYNYFNDVSNGIASEFRYLGVYVKSGLVSE